MRRGITALISAFALATLATGGAAQGATLVVTGDVPAPEECTVEPRSYEEMRAIAATPALDDDAHASPIPVVVPEGEPADEATAEAIRAAIRELVACINAGDFWRVLAVYSDAFVHRFFAGGDESEFSQELYDWYATPAALDAAQRIVVVEFREILLLPDGRAVAVVVGDDPTDAQPPSPTLFTIVQRDGRWLIDDFAELEADE